MKAISSIDVLGAAAYALVSERCRQSYLHDIRGGLQTLNSAVELLIRAANSPAENTALAEKASVLARRAVQKQEKLLLDLLNDLTPQTETASRVNIGELMSEVLRFVANDVAGKSVSIRLQSATELCVLVERHKFRLLILGLVCMLADDLAPGSVVEVTIARSASHALIEFLSSVARSSLHEAKSPWESTAAMSSPGELLLALTRQWTVANGGGLELSPTAIRIRYPAAEN